jgi:serine/threonine protein kinase
MIHLHDYCQDAVNSIQTEIELLKKLDHPNIVKYIDFVQTKTHINIILEYVEGGSLHHLVKQNGMLGEYLVHVFVKQVLTGLDYLHSQGIVHRDIKGANLLYTKNGCIKLADFGYSIRLSDIDKTNSIVGTPYWMAPEIIEPKGNISTACDIWSLGITIIQLLTSKPPYYQLEPYPAMFRIVTDEYPPLPENISENLKDFLIQCFFKDPNKRPKSKDLLNHPWIATPNKKLVKKFFNENDSNTIPASFMNEWKNKFKNNLSSLTSLSQADKNEKTENESKE